MKNWLQIATPKLYILFTLMLMTALLVTAGRPYRVEAQESEPDLALEAQVEQIFTALTPNERVGQLFMVSFSGRNTDPDSNIARLIQEYHLGGVVLSARNQNFINIGDVPTQVQTLTNDLQTLVRTPPGTTLPVSGPNIPTPTAPPLPGSSAAAPPPLFIAVSHEGDGFPYTQLRSGLTNIPSQMALGATWNQENVQQVGQVVGQELSRVGVNMLFGPSLDVLDTPRPERGGGLGVRTFGGHPFWVGKLGQAYIQGVHEGSNHQVLTIARHFPGFGSSDRKINQGVPTILKSLDDLRRTELAPFFAVTNQASNNPDSLADGLMTAHVRYQGLPGNVPISLDARNLPTLLALKELAPWREAGGLIVSAPLGVPAALEGVVAGTDTFPARRLAQDAFLAGSDLLQLVDFAYTADPAAEFENITSAIQFFQEKYTGDPNFQTVVDRAVRRIIRAKVKIYGDDFAATQPRPVVVAPDQAADTTIDLDLIAQNGVTLITPLSQEGVPPLTTPPQPDETILIFTDDRQVQDCPTCLSFSLIETDALQNTILQLFGPDATGQIVPDQISSLSFDDLAQLAAVPPQNGGTPEPSPTVEPTPVNPELEALLEEADWVVFAMLDIDTETYPQSNALRQLLRNRYDLLRNKQLVLFAFNAPYFLDETEISQLTAYYAFYSKGPAYLRSAARLLFQQFQPGGASPVAIPAIGPLNLNPDPNQSIQLEPIQKIDADGETVELKEQETPVSTLDLKVGEGILFRTDTIIDKNGNPVPDGTVVDFFRFYPLEGLSLEPLSAGTVNGIAKITIIKERDTPLQIRASSNLAVQGVPFNIGPGIIDTPTPTVTATPTPTDTPTPTATTTATPTNTPSPTATPEQVPTPFPTQPAANGSSTKLLQAKPVDLLDLLYSLGGILLISGIGFALGGDRFSLEERVRPAMVAIALGLVGYISYIFMAMLVPRTSYLGDLVEQGMRGHWVAPLISLLGAVLGVVAWYLKPGRVFWIKDNLSTADLPEEPD